jgi:hypothetical protein
VVEDADNERTQTIQGEAKEAAEERQSEANEATSERQREDEPPDGIVFSVLAKQKRHIVLSGRG